MTKIARELLKIARGLAEYEAATEGLGRVVKKVFRGHPWKYDRKASAWVIMGEKAVERFYDQEFDDDADSVRSDILKRLGGKFDGYKIIADIQDSYILIGLD